MLKLIYGDWYNTLIEGADASYFDLRLSARVSARARGYRFVRIELEAGRIVEIWETINYEN